MSSLLSSFSRLARALLCLCLAVAFLPEAAAAESVFHILAKGETLYSVARSYGVKPEAIVKANSIEDPSHLRAGMKLLIPGPGDAAPTAAVPLKHKVVKGDTLFSIARSYGVELDELRAANKLASYIKPGDILTIPAGGIAPAAPESSGPPATPDPQPAPAKVPAKEVFKSPSPAVPEAVKTSSRAVNAGLSWPCPGEILYLDGKAYGVVIHTKLGAAQKAVAAGTVSSAGPYRGYGNVVFVLSKTGHIYVYGGNDSLSVRAGDRILAGQELGKVGMDVKQGFPVSYFFVFKDGEAVDPARAPRD
jgi:murein DD-endopeptidase MepM/ murein hydrolase activator NlpD